MSFYADRREGLIWCEACVPAEIALLARERTTPRGRKRRLNRQVQLDRLVAEDTRLSVAPRCHVCGAVGAL